MWGMFLIPIQRHILAVVIITAQRADVTNPVVITSILLADEYLLRQTLWRLGRHWR